ncbi:MAG: hypothetical protein HYV63_13620 [Candidatus Schekmanbacteria bacterium]|nr:hypothetical protein [Candidatus Schekmanbacteria bacterium]
MRRFGIWAGCGAAILAAALLACAPAGSTAKSHANVALRILYVSGLVGHVDPCG